MQPCAIQLAQNDRSLRRAGRAAPGIVRISLAPANGHLGLPQLRFWHVNGVNLGGTEPPPPPPLPGQARVAAGPGGGDEGSVNVKPGSAKDKFSRITGPDIYYDGKSQKYLFECWAVLNTKRGVLHREIWCRRVMALSRVDYS